MSNNDIKDFDKRFFKLNDVIKFDDSQPKSGKKTIFFETDFIAGAVWCLRPGQETFTHTHTTSDDIWICVQGTGTMYPELGKEVTITKGDIILSRPNEWHGMKNTGDEDFVFIGIAGPLPMDLVLPENK